MDAAHPVDAKQFRTERSRFEQTVLLLLGGGALGSYQAGAYQALAEANLHPDWVAREVDIPSHSRRPAGSDFGMRRLL